MAPRNRRDPQVTIESFWRSAILRNKIEIEAVLPPRVPAGLTQDQKPKGIIPSESVRASYDVAARRCREDVAQIVRECRLVNQKYVDPYFDLLEQRVDCLYSLPTPDPPRPRPPPPQPDSVRGSVKSSCPTDDASEQLDSLSTIPPPGPSKRISDIFENPQFYVDGASATDIRQTFSGDCWFLSALASLTTLELEQNLVEDVCVDRNAEVGVYGFVFYRDGEWKHVIVDDQLFMKRYDYDDPEILNDMKFDMTEDEYTKTFQTNSKALYYSQSQDPNETWVPLIEKAYAKIHGDYSAINGGAIGEGIEDLTGGVSDEIKSSAILDKDEFWKNSLMKVNKDFLFGCESPGELGDEDNGQLHQGIEPGHGYAVLDARETKDGQNRLLKVRNPWGEGEWKGDWSDGSKQWTIPRMHELEHTFGDDGVFWISYKDFLRKYPVIWRTRIFDRSWNVAQHWANISVPWAGDFYDTQYEFTLPQKAPAVIVLSKLDDRYFRGLQDKYNFTLAFRLHKKGQEDYLIRSFGGSYQSRSASVELELEAGDYEVRLNILGEFVPERANVEDVVKMNWLKRRDKLFRIGLSRDLAYAKVTRPTLLDVAETRERERESKRETSEHKPQEEQQQDGGAAHERTKPTDEMKEKIASTATEAGSSPAQRIHFTSASANEDSPNPPVATVTEGGGAVSPTPETQPIPPQLRTRYSRSDISTDSGREPHYHRGRRRTSDDSGREEPVYWIRPTTPPPISDPWSASCPVGLRVYCKVANATIQFVGGARRERRYSRDRK